MEQKKAYLLLYLKNGEFENFYDWLKQKNNFFKQRGLNIQLYVPKIKVYDLLIEINADSWNAIQEVVKWVIWLRDEVETIYPMSVGEPVWKKYEWSKKKREPITFNYSFLNSK